MKRILAVDYGDVRIGLALSDPFKIISKPFKVIKNVDFSLILEEFSQIVAEKNIGLIVFGMPYYADGKISPKGQEVKKFADKISNSLGIKIEYYDERHSSQNANKYLINKGYSIKESKKIIDKFAAAVILENYLKTIQ